MPSKEMVSNWHKQLVRHGIPSGQSTAQSSPTEHVWKTLPLSVDRGSIASAISVAALAKAPLVWHNRDDLAKRISGLEDWVQTDFVVAASKWKDVV
jgi:hypothetical protein